MSVIDNDHKDALSRVNTIVPSAFVNRTLGNYVDRATIWVRDTRLSTDDAWRLINFVQNETNWFLDVVRWQWRDDVYVNAIELVRRHVGGPVAEPF